ncbi:MAG TPA: hypothetical protein VIM12_13275 [Noviherbaspirillum sp.]|uniref:hypothetical protein n=1 Tax=Noviherbaspirillum sp. TaxID=1926288 RepID=UPI002F93A040
MRKLMFYLTNQGMVSCTWSAGRPGEVARFGCDEEGRAAFAASLAGQGNVPATLLVDLIEEDFQRDTVPFVYGRARAALLQRRLAQMYRDTGHRQAMLQGREKTGRRDAQVLFSALTNSEYLAPWLKLLAQAHVPLAGVCSAALLAPALAARIDAPKGACLLLSLQSAGLRQSFLQDGQLRFSRLTPLEDASPASMAEAVVRESAKMRQFFASTRQLARDEVLRIAVVADNDQLDALRRICTDRANETWHWYELEAAAASVGCKDRGALDHADAIYLALAARGRAEGRYPAPEATRYYQLWQARVALNVLAAGAAGCALLWTGARLLDTWDAIQDTRALVAETAATEARHRLLMAGMPATVANPHDMKLAVDLHALLERNAPRPDGMLRHLGAALEAVPQVSLNGLRWTVPPAAGADPSAAPPPEAADAPPQAALFGLPTPPAQAMEIEGEIRPFRNDYRNAIDSVQQFAAALRTDARYDVQVQRLPLELKSSAALQGQAGRDEQEPRALFSLKLSWKPGT